MRRPSEGQMRIKTITTITGTRVCNICDKCEWAWFPHRDSLQQQCPKCDTRLWNRPAKPNGASKGNLFQRYRIRITRELLEQAILPQGGHAPTLREIGQSFGVTRERIRQRLAQEDIQKPPSIAAARCGVCHKLLHAQWRHPEDVCRCYHEAYKLAHAPVQLICGSCGVEFTVPLTGYKARYLRPVSYNGLRQHPRTTPPFCSKPCQGQWLGTHHRRSRRKVLATPL